MDEALESAPTEADPRAALLLRILNVAASKAATPNLAHLLLGYSVEMGVDVGLANPLTEFTALQAILKGLPVAVQIDVPLSEQMLALLATLVSRPATRDVTLDALRQDAYQVRDLTSSPRSQCHLGCPL